MEIHILTSSFGCIFQIFLLTYIVQAAWAICSECTEDNKDKILIMCQSPATRLEEAELTGNGSAVCKRFHQLLRCVGEEIPQCLDVISEQYEAYTYTPWDCHMSNEQVIYYQELVQKGCTSKSESQSGPFNGAVNIYTGRKHLVLGIIILCILRS